MNKREQKRRKERERENNEIISLALLKLPPPRLRWLYSTESTEPGVLPFKVPL